ncbi:uncharacterized protein LOC126691215 [Quercus robur]|uniref:uncharacterized protein LOC126691215 n=1 Tax=Quercus robur TaxID=38942 RepID=UPI0021627436|nr:uncharacterized protein LOC126691215 [Quercus robur]
MEMLKVRYLKEFCYRFGKCQKDLASIIEENEVKICHCYAEASKLNSEDFVKMVLLDATFIIEHFLRAVAGGEYENDCISSLKKTIIFPFLCLLAKNSPHEKEIPTEKEAKHFTDLIRYFYCQFNLQPGENISNLHSATKLNEAGVAFQMAEHGRLLDKKFQKSRSLEKYPYFNCSWFLNCLSCLKCFLCFERMQPVPFFVVDEGTDGLFRNLMALEQFHYPSESYICNYIVLLDYLVNSAEVVELLVEKKIIVIC